MQQRLFFALAVTLSVSAIAADAAAQADANTHKHLVYGEAGGKFGLYGVGYEYSLGEWISVGASGTTFAAGSRTTIGASVYFGIGTAIRGRHRWFAQLGPEVVRESEPAVPGFAGISEIGVGGQLSAGYEYRRSRWLIRGHGVVTVGKGGVAPWAGMSLGVRL